MSTAEPLRDQDGAVERIKVLFVMIHMAMGGTERLIFNLVRNLDRRVFEPSIAWLADEQPLREFEELHVPLYQVPKRGRFDWSTMKQLATIVRTHRIDVVNAHHFMSFFYAYYAAKLSNRVRLVYTEHSEADVLAAGGKWRAIGRYLLRSSDGAIGVSDRVSQTLGSHFGLDPQDLHTIENGVDVDLFSKDTSRGARLRGELGFSPKDVIIGHVANFRRNKNHVFLLRAFHALTRARPDARLVLIGQGFPSDPENSQPEIARYIESSGLSDSVRMLGYQSNVQDLLRMLDVFCLVSYKEGLPLSLIEAMASSLPVVGTDIEGIRTVIEPEINGLVVRPDDVPGLARALDRLVADAELRGRFGTASRRISEERHSLRRCVDQTQQLFLSMFPGRPATLRVSNAAAG